MTASGTYAFALETSDILTEAWERLTLDPAALTGAIARSAVRSLNLMLGQWATKGVNYWAVELVANVALTQGDQDIATPAGTIDILNMSIEQTTLNPGNVLPMPPIGRAEWMGIVNKTTQSRPTQFWLEKILPTPVIHLYPAPDANAAVISYYRIRQLQDFNALALQNPDVPWMYYNALCAGLAGYLAEKYAPAQWKDKMAAGQAAYDDAFAEDRERVPLTLTIDLAPFSW